MKKNSAFCSVLQGNSTVASPKEQLYEQTKSNPAFTERNIQQTIAHLPDSRPEQNLWSRITLYRVCTYVFGLSTLWLKQRWLDLSIICIWSPADICEQWERNYLPFGSAEVRGPGTRDEPLRMSVWEARAFKQALYLGESWEVTHELHMKGDECVRDGNMRLPRPCTYCSLAVHFPHLHNWRACSQPIKDFKRPPKCLIDYNLPQEDNHM